ncbi:efflux RND transporter periplasmic adaptor subunit [Neolewinella agarilytica]|uniref:efflux RND transporter periplasmic adaptor subunit n=1 Tax=Neolewinella agarilytica TaxID=478744 RepID=UPI002353F83B|nr:efflux RND transporter periplasmic adaptor subunit [Neolewinella agarilytica]
MRIAHLVLLLFLLAGCSEETTGIQPGRTTITEAVYGTVLVVPKEAYTVFSPVNGIIDQSMMKEGAEVKEGDELFRISDQRAKLEKKKARQNYVQALENYQGEVAVLKEMDERINSAKMSLLNDSVNYARQARLWKQNIGSRQAFETMELKFNTSRHYINELQKTYERTRQQLADQLALAGTSLEISGQYYDEHTIRAKMSGTIYQIEKKTGESVTTQTPVARIGSSSHFILELLIDEVDISRIELGQTVVVRLDAYRNQSYEAKISRILPHKNSLTQAFTVEAVFTQAPERLYDGLSGEANIVISRRENTMTLPTELIGPDNQVLTEDGERQVVTGISDLRYTEIISGIDSNTIVYQPE